MSPPTATESIKDSVNGISETIAKKLNLQKSAPTNGHAATENGITKNGTATNGTNGHVKSEPHVHPLDPLTPQEITTAATILRAAYPANSPIHFKAVTLDEPPKALVIPYLDAEHKGSPLPIVPRSAYVLYVMQNTHKTFEAIVDFTSGKLVSNAQIPQDCHAAADTSELYVIESIALSSPEVKKELERLKLPKGAMIACDPWTYGSDGDDDQTRKWQCYMYLRDPEHNHPESNHYAIPLDFSPRIDDATKKVDKIIRLPLFDTFDATPQTDYVVPSGNEYHHDLLGSKRTGLKPYNVVQPEGPSYGVDGNVVEWQKWRFRVGFNYREGLTLHDIRYDGRSVFYRLSLSDMFVPYADPRPPYHRKSAFDFGDVGAGITANNLKLGCDCLGVIKYFDGYCSDENGAPLKMENAVCLHEQDGGIGWKHTNYRTNVAAVIRARVLVVQTIITVANYEYIFAWQFGQAADIHLEVRATGILSTQPIHKSLNEKGSPYGTVVHDQVLAAHHQHIFSLRIDPAVDGQKNTLTVEEAHPIPIGKENPYGTGFVVKKRTVEKPGFEDLDITKARTFKIVNENSRNPVNGGPTGYKIYPFASQMLLADPSSFHARRAEFADHAIWLTKYADGQLYSGGKFTNQSRGGTGIKSFVAATADENVRNEDIVVWHSFSLTHLPRIEDFPVMPCEIITVSLKPSNFFEANPALDVPASEQHFNKSSLYEAENHMQGSQERTVGECGC